MRPGDRLQCCEAGGRHLRWHAAIKDIGPARDGFAILTNVRDATMEAVSFCPFCGTPVPKKPEPERPFLGWGQSFDTSSTPMIDPAWDLY
jgi:hypothetical protein